MQKEIRHKHEVETTKWKVLVVENLAKVVHVWSNVSKSRWGAHGCVESNPTIDGATILWEGMWYGDIVQCCTCTLSKARRIWGNIHGTRGGKLGWQARNF
jgi:hypothetical protein